MATVGQPVIEETWVEVLKNQNFRKKNLIALVSRDLIALVEKI